MPSQLSKDIIKLSWPTTREYWELPVLFEDEHVLALNKPSRLLASPDRYHPDRPSLMQLLHHDIARGAHWVQARPGLNYLMNAHRLDFETSGVFLLAKSKPVLVTLANLFGSGKPNIICVALVQGVPAERAFTIDVKLAPHTMKTGLLCVDSRRGKRSRTDFEVRERFAGYSLLQCHPRTQRTHQIRVHLQHARLPIVGDVAYGGGSLLLSCLKSDYRLKSNRTERPLISSAALHAEQLAFVHPPTQAEVKITAPWPHDLTVAAKYLRRYASVPSGGAAEAGD